LAADEIAKMHEPMGPNWLLRVEYLHYDFGDSGNTSAAVSFPGLGTSAETFTTGHLTADVVRTGLSYKFD
jgi:opacity protein-like surface antigen